MKWKKWSEMKCKYISDNKLALYESKNKIKKVTKVIVSNLYPQH